MGLKSFLQGIMTVDEDIVHEIDEEDNQVVENLKRDKYLARKIFDLKVQQSTYSYVTMTSEEIILQEEESDYKTKWYELFQKATELEKADLPKAIKIYEEFVEERWDRTTNPYDRLAIIYRKQKMWDDEIRVVKIAIVALSRNSLFSGNDYSDYFLDRLEKAIVLREKAQGKTLPAKVKKDN